MTDDRTEVEVLMAAALEAAVDAGSRGDPSHGAAARWAGQLVTAGDRRRSSGDPTAHAVASVVGAVAGAVGSWRLPGLVVAATHEPCPMCAGALISARVARLAIGVAIVGGAAGSRYNVLCDPRLGHEVEVVTGVLGEECRALG